MNSKKFNKENLTFNKYADQVTHTFTFKRSIATLIFGLINPLICLGVIGLVLYYLIKEYDNIGVFIILIFGTYLGVFLIPVIGYFKQPIKVTVTSEKKVIIGDYLKEYNASDVLVKFYPVDNISNNGIKILLMGYILGMIHYIAKGTFKLEFNCPDGKKYELNYLSFKTLKKLSEIFSSDQA